MSMMAEEKAYYDVSILSLIASPDKQKDKSIIVEGVFDFIGDSAFLYATKDYYDSKITKGRINIDLKSLPKALCVSKGLFVRVFGDFNVYRGELGYTEYLSINEVIMIRVFNSVIYPESHAEYAKGVIELFKDQSCSR